jgi:arabinose-5-phosphate isomerase
MGDALTVALMEERDFQPEHFARFHPGGSLGRRLLSKVRDEMVTDHLPFVQAEDKLSNVIHSITSGGLGLALVLDENNLPSIITDGDLRRAIEKYGKNVFDLMAIDIAKRNPLSISVECGIQPAYELMEEKKIGILIVEEKGTFIGVLKK